jgi:hypothetical protein
MPRLALAQGFLGAFALGDVPDDAHHRGTSRHGVAHRVRTLLQPDHATVAGAHDAKLVVPGAAASHRRLDQRAVGVAILGMQHGHRLGAAREYLAGRQPEERIHVLRGGDRVGLRIPFPRRHAPGREGGLEAVLDAAQRHDGWVLDAHGKGPGWRQIVANPSTRPSVPLSRGRTPPPGGSRSDRGWPGRWVPRPDP